MAENRSECAILIQQDMGCCLLLCLDLYVLSDVTSMGWGSSVRTGHLCVLVCIGGGGEVGTVEHV